MDTGFADTRTGFAEMRTGFAMMGVGFEAIAERLDRMDPDG